MGQTFKVLWQPYILLSAYELVLASLFLVLSLSDLTLYPSGEFSNDNSEKQLNSVEHISCYYLYNVTIQKLAQGPKIQCQFLMYDDHSSHNTDGTEHQPN